MAKKKAQKLPPWLNSEVPPETETPILPPAPQGRSRPAPKPKKKAKKRK